MQSSKQLNRRILGAQRRSPIQSLSDNSFELFIVTIILAGTLTANYFVGVAPVMLHFFYLPVIVAAHYFGRRLACTAALLSCLVVIISAAIEPNRYLVSISTPLVLALMLGAWAGFLGLNALLVGTLSDQRRAQVQELRQAYMGIIEILSKYLQAADQYTKSHSMRVADMSESIAAEMGLKQAEIEDIRVGALLHDVGKVEISTRIIQKAAGLNDTEQEEMASHTVRGAELVRSLGTILEGAIPIILHHHDHYSNTSKQDGKHGTQIPIGARVVAVADAYDAIVTDRPYRRGRTPHEAVVIIQEGAGTQFDPDVVKAFERVVSRRAEEPESEVRPIQPREEMILAGLMN